MGSLVEINDTLQITREQGFPPELDYQRHLEKPLTAKDFEGRIFEFKDKPKIRIYHLPPVRVFLVQNIGEKWLYWGLVHIVEITHDNIKKTTSGKYIITHIFSPTEMKEAFRTIDRRDELDYIGSR